MSKLEKINLTDIIEIAVNSTLSIDCICRKPIGTKQVDILQFGETIKLLAFLDNDEAKAYSLKAVNCPHCGSKIFEKVEVEVEN